MDFSWLIEKIKHNLSHSLSLTKGITMNLHHQPYFFAELQKKLKALYLGQPTSNYPNLDLETVESNSKKNPLQ